MARVYKPRPGLIDRWLVPILDASDEPSPWTDITRMFLLAFVLVVSVILPCVPWIKQRYRDYSSYVEKLGEGGAEGVRLQGLKAENYNGCVARVLEDDTDSERLAVFVYKHRKAIQVFPERIVAVSPWNLFDAALVALAQDELPLMLKDAWKDKDPPVIWSTKGFLDAQGYREKCASKMQADSFSVCNVLRLVLRLTGLPALPAIMWCPELEKLSDAELAEKQFTSGGVEPLKMNEIRLRVDEFFSKPRPFGILMSYSEAPADINFGLPVKGAKRGHCLTILQVGPRFRLVHSCGSGGPGPSSAAVFSLKEWLESIDDKWMSIAEAKRIFGAWIRCCTVETATSAAQNAAILFRRKCKPRDESASRPLREICVTMILDTSPSAFLNALENVLSHMIVALEDSSSPEASSDLK